MVDMPSVPMVDLLAQLERIRPEVDAAVARVLQSTQFIHGEDCGRLEEEFAAYCGARYAVAVANGTDALALALRAYGVGPGDEVVTAANTFIATGEAILLNGARPVFVDVDPETFTMDPEALEAAITTRTRVILPVHLYGHPAPMAAINRIAGRHGLPVLEDAAQAHGAEENGRRAGSLGHAACFSFYPGKNLGAYGDAGMVVSSDEAFIARVRQVANHGAGASRYDNLVLGTNSRLDTLQAAILRVKLRHLPRWDEERRERVRAYTEALADVPGLRPATRKGGVALRLAPLHRAHAGSRRAPRPPEGPGDRHRGALPETHPPAAGHGGGRRKGRRPPGVGAPLPRGALAAPLPRAAPRRPAPRRRRGRRPSARGADGVPFTSSSLGGRR